MKRIILKVLIVFTLSPIFSQVAPTSGKKTLEVKESYEGEYLEDIKPEELPQNLTDRMKKTFLKKSKKYGFTDIKVLSIGQVYYPSGGSNPNLDFKFQAHILDNVSGKVFKIRLNTTFHSPDYIIKEPNQDFYCSKIKSEVDKFNGKETLSSPLGAITFYKIKSETSANHYMSIIVKGPTANISKKNVIILFEDGSKITRPDEKIKISMGKGSNYDYSSTFQLDEQDIEKLKKGKITDVRLYIHDKEITNGDVLNKYFNCIVK